MVKINNDNSISQHSKTFSFASIFLPNKIKYDVYKMYQFCRSYDDSADKDVTVPDKKYETELNKLGINKKALEQLKIGIDSDRNFNRFIGMDDLIVYSYRVAGCVGIMMCDVLNVENDKDKYYAIDLGIAMQITNICRDVFEDATNKRIYIPKEIMPNDDLNSIDNQEIFKYVCKLHDFAEEYYSSALNGITSIPLKSRFSILLALRLYQAIGRKILSNENLFFKQTINTTLLEKLKIFLKCIFEFFFCFLFRFKKNHNSELHSSLTGLPFIHDKV